MAKLNGGNKMQTFRVECWDNSKSGKHTFIGFLELSMNDIATSTENTYKLKNPKEVLTQFTSTLEKTR